MVRRRANNRPQVPFAYKLVLNQWMLCLFEVDRFEQLAEHLRDERLEGMDENNIHRLHHQLAAQFFELKHLPTELLLEYDQNIVRHTQRLNDKRITRGEDPIVWKYFQYLTLLFTEIFLDRYFTDPDALLIAINEQIKKYNEDKPDPDKLRSFEDDADARTALNKLAYWSATGSGKTLVMHVNILQYQHYLEKHGRRRDLNRIILLTPNEGLSLQHLDEFDKAGIPAELFNKDGQGLFAGRSVEIIDIHKLKDEMGDKTVAVDAFEGNNLVLIDEGHRGAGRGETGAWMRFRNTLCEEGFSFEYSATFGQAVKGDDWLTNLYARCTLIDYSYKYFYGDGFGKDYQILNLDEGTQDNYLDVYLVACLLAFFQQQRLYTEHRQEFGPFNIEKPLWIFVGGKVTATLATKDASDIEEILKFLAGFIGNRQQSIDYINRVLTQGIQVQGGRNLFSGRFAYLNMSGLTASQVFDEVLKTLFNAPGGGSIHVENLKGATGEIALRVGDNDPFGVINVGDDAKLCKLFGNHAELIVTEREFSGSLFRDINQDHSTVNVLIGSRKFTEGWSSWRVSTMGLMNIGASEGAQIIQLFGRGVRLKGYGKSLKRSGRTYLPEELSRPKHISVLETLSIFGIHADYMAQFRDFLKDEGLPPNEELVEILLPVIKGLGTKKLRTIRLKKTINGVNTEFGDAFKKLGPVPTLKQPDPATEPATQYLQKNQVILNWYPKIQALKSIGAVGGDDDAHLNEAVLSPKHVAFINIDKLYFELQRFKAERAWHNFNLSQDVIRGLLADQSWYRVLIPEQELSFATYANVGLWQEIAGALLKKYCERYYTFRKREWELPHLEYRDLSGDDPNFPSGNEDHPDGYYRVLVEESQEEIIAKLNELKALIEADDKRAWTFNGLTAIWFGQHLYQPLLHLKERIVEIRPVPLNKGERRFVEDLRSFHDGDEEFFKDKELYLLRNMSRGRGVGFFEAGNFHPDFILWLVCGGKQFVTFVDPKGLRNIGPSDPKVQFYKTVKEIEQRLGDPNVVLNSFIVSNTPSHTMSMLWSRSESLVDKAWMSHHHILFQDEDRATYIHTMLEMALLAPA